MLDGINIPDIAFKTALGINSLTVLCFAWVLKGQISLKAKNAKAFAMKLGMLVLGFAVVLSLSLFLAKWFGPQ